VRFIHTLTFTLVLKKKQNNNSKLKKMVDLGMIGAWQLILLVVVLLLGVLPTIIALIDILKSDFRGNNKIVWLLVVLLTNFFGAILYFLIGREQKIKSII
jgi:hypothetical protein